MTMKSAPLKMQKLFTGGCNKFWFSFSHLGKLSGGSRGISWSSSVGWAASLFRVGGYSNIQCPFLEFVISSSHVMCMKPRALNSCVCLAIPFKYPGFWTSPLHFSSPPNLYNSGDQKNSTRYRKIRGFGWANGILVHTSRSSVGKWEKA